MDDALTVSDEANEARIELRQLTLDDYADMVEATHLAYAGMAAQPWARDDVENLLTVFPDGQLCVTMDGKAVGFALTLIVSRESLGDSHTYAEVTGDYTFSTHDPNGDVLYGIDVMVHTDYRGIRIARRLYEGRKALCENLNLQAIIAGGRIPGYSEHSSRLTPQEYIERVVSRELHDPVLSFQLANNFHVRRLLTDYLASDNESKAYATQLEWNNLGYQEPGNLLDRLRPLVRIGVVQMQMNPLADLDQLLRQCEYYIEALGSVRCDFVLLPELFNMGLMAASPDARPARAIRQLAAQTQEIRERIGELAIRHHTNVIAGSLPLLEGRKLYNVSYLCRRDGTFAEQRKIHITPGEKRSWGMVGGNELCAFDTDCGRVGILICYDSEFPELGRVLSDQGAKILFVPFMTEMQSGYQRVRFCARARAIENECYVAIAGAVGSLPDVRASDMHYAQSAVFTPSDFAFPANSTICEASPNSEALVVGEVNLELLRQLNSRGTVMTLRDRRTELYEVNWRQAVGKPRASRKKPAPADA